VGGVARGCQIELRKKPKLRPKADPNGGGVVVARRMLQGGDEGAKVVICGGYGINRTRCTIDITS
jgi:hypothetical protein